MTDGALELELLYTGAPPQTSLFHLVAVEQTTREGFVRLRMKFDDTGGRPFHRFQLRGGDCG
jgi:hypothetical protein